MSGFEVRPIAVAATRELRQSVLRPHETVAELAAREPEDAFAVGAFVDGELVAVGMIRRDGDPAVWRLRGMATAPHARGRGAGGEVLAALIGHAAANRARRVWCNARTPALSLYARAGFVAVSGEFEIPGIGPHHRLELALDP